MLSVYFADVIAWNGSKSYNNNVADKGEYIILVVAGLVAL